MHPLRTAFVTGRASAAAGALFLVACGGAPALAQPTPPDDGLAHPYLYEVAADQGVTAQAGAGQEAPFIEVNGNATVKVTPDRVSASFAVETRAATAGEAASQNAALMDRVVRALRASGAKGIRVETFGYVLRPEYSFPGDDRNRVRVIDGYTALNNIRATADDVAAAGTLVDTAIGAGANRVAALAFEASDTEAARREALGLAVRNARLQAEAMAQALGRALGPAMEVRGGADVPYPRASGDVMFRAVEMAAETPIEAGDLSVSANVTIRFALGGEGR